MATHIYCLQVSETDLDVFGHVNNAQYLRYFEMARWDFLNSRGISLKELMSSGVGPVILEVQLRFLRELRARESLRIESHFEPFEGKISRIRQFIFSEKADKPSAEAIFTAALFDTRQRKMVEPTGVWAGLADSQ